MKRYLLLCAVVVIAFLTACGNKSGAGSAAASSAAGGGDANAVDLVVGANYYFESKDDDGNIVYKYGNWLQPGDTVRVMPGEVKVVKVLNAKDAQTEDMIGPARIVSSERNEKDVNKDVYVSSYYIVPGQRAGAITAANGATVFNGLDPTNVTGKILPRRTIVAVAPIDNNENPLGRQRFIAYNVPQPDDSLLKAGSWSPFYINPGDVSTSVNDVKMAQEITKMEKKPKEQWGTIAAELERAYGDSIFLADAKAMIGQAGGLAARATEVIKGKATVSGDNVAVYTEPDEKAGSIIGNLTDGTKVNVIGQTVDSYAFGDDFARWFKIKSGELEGWVFGSSLSVE
ncbi:MAG: SH3 domain-containing protein [Spirochaetales bacterium]|nr:SH3 domain-containing protein [Spirochaetales bacterium]